MRIFVVLCAFVLLVSCASSEEVRSDVLQDDALRREVFARWIDATLRAEAEARELSGGDASESLQASDVYEIYDRHLTEVASEFGIPEVEVLAIQVEGLANDWPRPEQEP